VARGIILPSEHHVLKGELTLPPPVIAPEQGEKLFDPEGVVGRHELIAFIVKGRVETDGKVAFAFIEEAL